MLRNTAVQRIPQYNFGHPALSKAFGMFPRPYTAPPKTQVQKTKLPNGVTVVTHDLGAPISVFGLYADAGAKYDPVSVPGMSYVMRWAIQTSNMDNSLFQLDRVMRANGIGYGHGEIRKQFLSWKGEGRRDKIEKPFDTLATCISAPRFHESDIERFRDTMDNLLEEQRWQNPRAYVIDQLETVAFYKEPLGNPRHIWAASNDKASTTTLLNHWASYFTPNRITVAGVNVEHEKLVSQYSNLPFPHSAEAPHHVRASKALAAGTAESAQFYAGKQSVEIEDRAKAMCTTPDMQPEMAAAFGWATHGRDGDVAKYAAAAVAVELVSVLLNDGIQYDRHDNHLGVRAFYRPYETAGLIGFTVRGSDAASKTQVQSTLESLNAAKPTPIQHVAARNRALVSFFNNEVERSSDYADFLATSKHSEETIEKAIREVSAEAVDAVLKHIATTTPSMFATGNAYAFPSLKQFGFKQ